MNIEIPENEGPRATTCFELSRKFDVPLDVVLRVARCNGIGVADGTTKVAAMQLRRLLPALGEELRAPRMPSGAEEVGDKRPRFSWDLQKLSLGPDARRLVPNWETMWAVERVAVAEQAVCLISRKNETPALVVIVNSLCVVLGRDIRHGRPAFVITAYDKTKPRLSDQSAEFIRGASLVTGVVPIESRLALLPEVCA